MNINNIIAMAAAMFQPTPAAPSRFTPGKRSKSRANGADKCARVGHLYSNLGTARNAQGESVMAGCCRRCGQAHALIPCRPAENNLHPNATRESREHWLRQRIIHNWVYINGKPDFYIGADQQKGKAA